MAILLHVLIAFSSLVYTGLTFLQPSKCKLFVSYIFVVLTLGTGFGLVVAKPLHMVESCMVGLIYLGTVSIGMFFARRKLAILKRQL
jgi:hypothetical protein